MSLSDIASLFAIIFGLIGAILGYLSYFRDKPKIVVTLQWDMKILNIPKYDPNKYWGIVTITIIRRRPVFIQGSVLKLPKKYDSVLMLFDSPVGSKKLEDGDPPLHYIIDQSQLEQYSKDWKKIKAEVKISTGKIFSSKKIDKNKIPSWVNIE